MVTIAATPHRPDPEIDLGGGAERAGLDVKAARSPDGGVVHGGDAPGEADAKEDADGEGHDWADAKWIVIRRPLRSTRTSFHHLFA
jgi:hypothetical protein